MGSQEYCQGLNEDINEEWISDKTRYSCDGLLNQRLDTPYVKHEGRLVKSNWDDVLKIISDKINSVKARGKLQVISVIWLI